MTFYPPVGEVSAVNPLFQSSSGEFYNRFTIHGQIKIAESNGDQISEREARRRIACILRRYTFSIFPLQIDTNYMACTRSSDDYNQVITDGGGNLSAPYKSVSSGDAVVRAYHDGTSNTYAIQSGECVVFDMVTGTGVTGINPCWHPDEYVIVGIAHENFNRNCTCCDNNGQEGECPQCGGGIESGSMRLVRIKLQQFKDQGPVRKWARLLGDKLPGESVLAEFVTFDPPDESEILNGSSDGCWSSSCFCGGRTSIIDPSCCMMGFQLSLIHISEPTRPY